MARQMSRLRGRREDAGWTGWWPSSVPTPQDLTGRLTILVGCHQLVDLLICPGCQDLNEALLICADALGEEKKYGT